MSVFSASAALIAARTPGTGRKPAVLAVSEGGFTAGNSVLG